MLRFYEKTDKTSYRLVGSDYDTLIEDALKFVLPDHRKEAREILEAGFTREGWAKLKKEFCVFDDLYVFWDPSRLFTDLNYKILSDQAIILGYHSQRRLRNGG